MEFYQLEQFRAIANNRTMREAAASLHLSQPTLSQNLRKLEGEVGHKLFDRVHNQMRLTPYGVILLDHTDRLMKAWDSLREDIAEEERRQAKTVKIGCYSSVRAFFELPQLASAFPDLQFEVWVDYEKEVMGGFADGVYDIILVPQSRAASKLKLIEIDKEQALLSIPVRSKLAKKESLVLDDLKGISLLVPSDLKGVSSWYADIVSAAGADVMDVELVSQETYMKKLDITQKCHFSTSLMSRLTTSGSGRVEIPIDAPVAWRSSCFAYNMGDDRLTPLAEFLKAHAFKTFSGHAFLPFVLGRGLTNVVIHDGVFSKNNTNELR